MGVDFRSQLWYSRHNGRCRHREDCGMDEMEYQLMLKARQAELKQFKASQRKLHEPRVRIDPNAIEPINAELEMATRRARATDRLKPRTAVQILADQAQAKREVAMGRVIAQLAKRPPPVSKARAKVAPRRRQGDV